MEFITVYFNDGYDTERIDVDELESLFGVEISLGSNYINAYTIDRSVVDSIANEIGHENVMKIVYT